MLHSQRTKSNPSREIKSHMKCKIFVGNWRCVTEFEESLNVGGGWGQEKKYGAIFWRQLNCSSKDFQRKRNLASCVFWGEKCLFEEQIGEKEARQVLKISQDRLSVGFANGEEEFKKQNPHHLMTVDEQWRMIPRMTDYK